MPAVSPPLSETATLVLRTLLDDPDLQTQEIIAVGPYGDQLDAESVKTVLLGELFENLLAVPMDAGWVATDKAKEERAKWLGP
jgi:hypothetical protein